MHVHMLFQKLPTPAHHCIAPPQNAQVERIVARSSDEETCQPTVLVKWRGLDYDKARAHSGRACAVVAWRSCSLRRRCKEHLQLHGTIEGWVLWRPNLGHLTGVEACNSIGNARAPSQATWESAADMEGEKEALQQVCVFGAMPAGVVSTTMPAILCTA